MDTPHTPSTEDFDTVVVGSGFGASVTAYRLALAGQRVCVLERGRPYPPGSFPQDPRGLAANLWDPAAGLHGLFDVWAFNRIESVVSSGLGGGSLIYANVLLRKDEHWFVDEALPGDGYERWPIDRALLDPHYDAVEKMLDAQQYPSDVAPYNQTPKTIAMRDAAEKLKLDWLRPNLAVSFRSPGDAPSPGVPLHEERPNLHGRPRQTCRLCGECDAGCNYGAKNSLDYTYLSRAKDYGAEIRTLSEVRSLEPVDGPGGGTSGYRVTYVTHQLSENQTPVPLSQLRTTTVKAHRLVLGAGTFGTTYLLLRNRSAIPLISPALGTRFSGNGDLLTAIVKAHQGVNGQSVPRYLDPSIGPVITSAIRLADSHDGTGATGRGFYVEDGGNPAFLDWVAESAGALSLAGRTATFLARRAVAHLKGDPRSHISSDISKLLGGGQVSANAVPMLAIGRDIPDGVIRLRNGDLEVNFNAQSSKAYFDRVQQTLNDIATALGGQLLNPLLQLFKRVITVHPLGGAPMARNDREGVIDRNGEMFHYPGLYVVDGAAMPGPVGANPSLTIAAFADHVADGIVSAAEGSS
jgi:cholesterol oxidase